MKYIIHWKSLLTGKSGKGLEAFPYETAKRMVDELNRTYAGLLHHWLEPEN